MSTHEANLLISPKNILLTMIMLVKIT